MDIFPFQEGNRTTPRRLDPKAVSDTVLTIPYPSDGFTHNKRTTPTDNTEEGSLSPSCTCRRVPTGR